MPDNAQLIVTDLTREFATPEGPSHILTGVSFAVAPGETVAIVGPSGSGKSTLLHLIGSLDHPSGGSVRLGETEVHTLTGKALAAFRASQVGFVFQDHHLLPQLTALENVLLPSLAVTQADRTQRGQELLEQVGVAHRAHALPAQLSGGERQRVAIARAFINGTRLLLCDEPTGNLDRETGDAIITLFLDLAMRDKVMVLMVTHNLRQAARFARCLELRDGQLYPYMAAAGGPR